MSDTAYYLSAVVGRDRDSLEVRTKIFSLANLEALLEDDPAAITFAPEGALFPERLLDIFVERMALPAARRRPVRAQRGRPLWRFYEKKNYEPGLHWVRSVDSDDLKQQLDLLRHTYQVLAAFVSEGVLTDTQPFSMIDSVISEAISPRETRRPRAPQSENPEAANRKALHAAREDMLKRVGSYSSEQLASGLDSTTSNASQCAADQRKAGKVFGVRFGREWRYPKFQFDQSRKPLNTFDEMKPILGALSPDERGWDRLQWFLEPHEVLGGLTPLEVWTQDRAKVVAAASTERWDVRD
jgi:hypothetical protein